MTKTFARAPASTSSNSVVVDTLSPRAQRAVALQPALPAIAEAAPVEHGLLGELRRRVEVAVDEELVGTDWTARNCPWLEYWFGYYQRRSPEQLEAALRKYVGAEAFVVDPIGAVVERVRAAVVRWRATGEIDAPPAAIPDSVEVMTALGPGQPIDSGVRARMEDATGTSLAGTRIHTDAVAARVASSEDARALAIGGHVAFAANQYRPGTLEGDALIAHELAHTMQQRGASETASAQHDSGLEHGADRFALGALGRLYGGTRGVPEVASTRPAATGLRLQRCSNKKDTPEPPTPTPSPSPSPSPPWTKPTVSVTMTGHDRVQGTDMPSVQPVDVAGELAYERFELREPHTVAGASRPAHTVVRPTAWDNASATVHVILDADPGVAFDVPKWKIRPLPSPGRGVVLYQADKTSVDAQADIVKRREGLVADWNAKQASFRSKPEAWQSEHDDRARELAASQASLNVFQIKQLMINRFDEMIVRQVDAANTRWTPAVSLDPNIVKSIIYRETQMGTSGAFMDDTSARVHLRINHWNITQAIDSWGEMYARMIVEEHPALAAAHGISDILTKERQLQRKFEVLDQMPSRNAAQEAEYQDVKARTHDPSGKLTSEPFFRGTTGLTDAIAELNATTSPPLNNTYEHWIEMMIYELFVYYKNTKSWPDAVEQYNGRNAKYRKEVLDRVTAAREAQRRGRTYVPSHGE